MTGYDYSKRVTTGGPNGTYYVDSPWSSPCEYAIAFVCATGAGGVSITDVDDSAGGYAVPVAAAPSADGISAVTGVLLNFGAATVIAPDALFTPMTSRRVCVQVSGVAAAAILVTFVFRRQAQINATFPALPQVHPDDEALYHQLVANANQQAGAEVAQTQWDVQGKVRPGHGR